MEVIAQSYGDETHKVYVRQPGALMTDEEIARFLDVFVGGDEINDRSGSDLAST